MKRKIYLASSWRNAAQPMLVETIRTDGHEVYDFRNPEQGNLGFGWAEVQEDWYNWKPAGFGYLLATNATIKRGFDLDKSALDWCDTCVLLLPCGRSAHLEAGYCIGQGKPTFILLSEKGFEPELMYKLAVTCLTDDTHGILQLLRMLEALK